MGLLAYFRTLSESSDRMERMMQALKVKARIAELPDNGAVLRRAAVRCCSCEATNACEDWLENNNTATEAPAYCRNHDLFARLAEQIPAEKTPA